ncbi:MAG: glutamine-hydrolyzing carbamoyl-phosphate synthase small subunit [Nitrososphaerales archaeon]
MRVLNLRSTSTALKLVLEDGEVFDGYSFGYFQSSPVIGEVVFNTGMVGYTEAMTDPSYIGQILCFTYPLLGNYGVPDYLEDKDNILVNFESSRIQVNGVIANQVADEPSHFQSRRSVGAWMQGEGIPGIEGLDTRELTLHLREKGVMLGAITAEVPTARKELEAAQDYNKMNFYSSASAKEKKTFGKNIRGIVALIDCGVKLNIIRSLVNRGFAVTALPYDSTYDEVVSLRPDGVVFSNGPGDPKMCRPAVELARSVIEESLPTLGICLGTQIIALSQGADTFKLKYGHRGQNKPCIDLKRGRCMVTSQNHGYSVDEASLKNTKLEPWFVNADDHTIEGLVHKTKPCISVQFHPEGSPGPLDPSYVFDVFAEQIRRA